MYTVDSALQHTCAEFREQAARGEISGPECDLLTDGAILLALHLEALIQDALAGQPAGWPGPGQRRERLSSREALSATVRASV